MNVSNSRGRCPCRNISVSICICLNHVITYFLVWCNLLRRSFVPDCVESLALHHGINKPRLRPENFWPDWWISGMCQNKWMSSHQDIYQQSRCLLQYLQLQSRNMRNVQYRVIKVLLLIYHTLALLCLARQFSMEYLSSHLHCSISFNSFCVEVNSYKILCRQIYFWHKKLNMAVQE